MDLSLATFQNFLKHISLITIGHNAKGICNRQRQSHSEIVNCCENQFSHEKTINS